MHAGTGKCTAVRKSLISGTRLMVHIPQLYQLFDGAPSGCGASRPKMGGDTFLPMGIRVSQVLETPFRARWCTPARLMHHPGAESAWSAGIAGSGMCTTKSNTKQLLGRNIVSFRSPDTPALRPFRAPCPPLANAQTGMAHSLGWPVCLSLRACARHSDRLAPGRERWSGQETAREHGKASPSRKAAPFTGAWIETKPYETGAKRRAGHRRPNSDGSSATHRSRRQGWAAVHENAGRGTHDTQIAPELEHEVEDTGAAGNARRRRQRRCTQAGTVTATETTKGDP